MAKKKRDLDIEALMLELSDIIAEVQEEIELADGVWDKACRVSSDDTG